MEETTIYQMIGPELRELEQSEAIIPSGMVICFDTRSIELVASRNALAFDVALVAPTMRQAL